jgi:hypothetical protein
MKFLLLFSFFSLHVNILFFSFLSFFFLGHYKKQSAAWFQAVSAQTTLKHNIIFNGPRYETKKPSHTLTHTTTTLVWNRCILFCSILFYSILFYYILFYFILFYLDIVYII